MACYYIFDHAMSIDHVANCHVLMSQYGRDDVKDVVSAILQYGRRISPEGMLMTDDIIDILSRGYGFKEIWSNVLLRYLDDAYVMLLENGLAEEIDDARVGDVPVYGINLSADELFNEERADMLFARWLTDGVKAQIADCVIRTY